MKIRTQTKRHSFHALLNKNMNQVSEEARAEKIPKERFAIIFCVSVAGEKEKLPY